MLAFIEIIYQIWLVNEYARKKKAILGVTKSQSFLVRYRRTYVFKFTHTHILSTYLHFKGLQYSTLQINRRVNREERKSGGEKAKKR